VSSLSLLSSLEVSICQIGTKVYTLPFLAKGKSLFFSVKMRWRNPEKQTVRIDLPKLIPKNLEYFENYQTAYGCKSIIPNYISVNFPVLAAILFVLYVDFDQMGV
jgi:hypothetical protein